MKAKLCAEVGDLRISPAACTVKYESLGAIIKKVCYLRVGKIQFACPPKGKHTWRSWLRHNSTNRKVAGSIPYGVIGIFHWHNPSIRTMTLGSTQPLTEMSTWYISWGVKTAGAGR